eukprot:CAMPEP_0194133764 /NCGR_PEP_ID=MMETSP0152-20130528/3792_1 /TAXON_ID=1049557 /ORGANISM="Thalassiothrix antarctica, Strain L6-D1" /LENGTH=597 /DNA_ID=CAMNT_0038829119 /DNA_START=89 /DNA_END=1882 /DNA_ORIENTATION=+
MAFNVGEGTSYVVLFSILAFFTLLAVASADYFRGLLPNWLNKQLVLKDAGDDTGKESATENGNRSADFFLSARNSASATQIALSVFASGMGAWIFYGPTEMGANPRISWIGLIGYSFASTTPSILACILGPIIKERCTDSSFNLTDFGRQRYGIVMQVVISCMSIFYMMIYLTAEMTSIANIYAKIGNKSDLSFTSSVTIAVAVITIIYTSIGGLPASIITDKIQAIMVIVLVLMLGFALGLKPENSVPEGNFALASNWTNEGGMASVTLVFAIISAGSFNLATWQRVWAAKSVPDMRKGFIGGSVMIFMLMMFFGIMGMIAYSLDPTSYDNDPTNNPAYLAFFDILGPLENAWHIVSLILVTSLATSSIDSIQNGLMSPFSVFIVRKGWNTKWIARALLVLINIPAVFLSTKQYNVISLFLVADLVCATGVLPIMFGLITEDKMGGLIPAPTEFGAFMGVFSGIVTVCIIGRVVDAPGNLFDYFWLKNDGICALCGFKTMITFVVTPFSSGFFCLLFSKLDVSVRGDAARNPLFMTGEKIEKGFYVEGAKESTKAVYDEAPVEMSEFDKNQSPDIEKVQKTYGNGDGYESEVSVDV